MGTAYLNPSVALNPIPGIHPAEALCYDAPLVVDYVPDVHGAADFMNGHDRWSGRCRKCGNTYWVKRERLTAAIKAGRRRLELGVDVG